MIIVLVCGRLTAGGDGTGAEASAWGLEPVDCRTGSMGRKGEVAPPETLADVEDGLSKVQPTGLLPGSEVVGSS